MNIAPWVQCTKCDAQILVESNQIDNYFNNESVICRSCNTSLNWWLVTQKTIRENFMFNQAFSVIGASSKIIEIVLNSESRTCIKLLEHGIPSNGRFYM
jgi:hypothetical protein